MEKIFKIFVLGGLTLGIIVQGHAQGFIVQDGVTLIPGTTTDLGSQIRVIQDPTRSHFPDFTDFTGFYLTPQGGNVFLFNPLLDEGVRTFFVSLNDPISLQPIMANNYAELTNPNSYVFGNNIPFYLGFYTGYQPSNGIYRDPLFGWGKFVNNNGVISMQGSALEYGGGGIYAGTQTIIPEPSTIDLAALGTLLLGVWRWRHSKRRKS